MLLPPKQRLIRARYRPRHASLFDMLVRLGLYGNLRLCLDAGSIASSPLSTTKWLDLSGNGNDFFRGTTVAVQSIDPSFNGNVGGLSEREYWGFDNTQYFTYDTTNEAWMQTLHKTGAVGTFATWVNLGSLAATNGFAGTGSATTSGRGFAFRVGTTSIINWAVWNGAGVVFNGGIAIEDLVIGQWYFMAISVNEPEGTLHVCLNDKTRSRVSLTYASPSASNASFTMQIGAVGNAENTMENGGQMGMIAAWDRQLSPDDLVRVFQATRGRYAI